MSAPRRWSFLALALAFALALAPFEWAQAQDYPTRPVTILVAFTPGGPSDVLSRIVGKRLQEILARLKARPDRYAALTGGALRRSACASSHNSRVSTSSGPSRRTRPASSSAARHGSTPRRSTKRRRRHGRL